MRVCTRCGNLATGRQRYCTRCVAPLDPPVDPLGLPGNPAETAGPGSGVLPVRPGYPRPRSPQPASPQPVSPGPWSPQPVSPRQIFVPDVERRQWDIRALRAGDYDDLLAGGEAETGVLPPLVIDDPLPDGQDDLADLGDRGRDYWDDGDDRVGGHRGQGNRGPANRARGPGNRARGNRARGDRGPGHRGPGHRGRPGTGRLLYPSADPRRASDGRRARIASAVLGAVLVLAGTLTAWAAVSRHGVPGGPGTQLSSSQASPAAAPATVTLAPGVGQDPAAGPVRSRLVSYFTAINAHRFSQYAQSFLPPVRHQLSAATFAAGYGSSTYTGITLVSITAARQGPAATVSFTSTRRSGPGANVTSCTDWVITVFLGRYGPGYLIGTPPPSYHAYHHACG